MASKTGLTEAQTLHIAAELRQARHAAAMTQEHLAGASGLSLRTIKRAESGEALSAETLRSIAATLNLDAAALIQVAEEMRETSLLEGETWIRPRRSSYSFYKSAIATLLIIGLSPMLWPLFFRDMDDISFTRAGALSVFPLVLAEIVAFKLGELGLDMASDPKRRQEYYAKRIYIITAAVLMCEAISAVAKSFGFSIFVLPAFLSVVGVFTTIYFLYEKQRAHLLFETAQRSFKDRMPSIIQKIQDAISRPVGAEALATVKSLIIEARVLADDCDRSDDILPLEFLAEDMLRGISGRARLVDYLVAARFACISREPEDRSERFVSDLTILFDDLRRRVSTIS